MKSTQTKRKVFVIGLPKTGTTSVDAALTMLGYRCRHNPFNFRALAMRGCYRFEPVDDWDALSNFGEHFYPQLDKEYPNSRFILTTREKESWLTSVERQFSKFDGLGLHHMPLRARNVFCSWKHLRRAVSYYIGDYFEPRLMHMRLQIFGSYAFNKDLYSQVYDLHLAAARAYFRDRKADYLEIELQSNSGWGPLCEFLDCEEPQEDFPHLRRPPSSPTISQE
ncbi:sulfotransferase [Coraliomargarita algicola]|uniref:Sulfotransferase n=1 Tax=Coraliomargarita algicola TaxID=3092156 RepID=A0ABZ0RND7_9BACT|nr:sulfotransferase [Coraliomargarita sp. J2-16]WPJ97739.1 sulfotransferase [Coraliomargarita sp. J2-16]